MVGAPRHKIVAGPDEPKVSAGRVAHRTRMTLVTTSASSTCSNRSQRSPRRFALPLTGVRSP